MSVSRSFHERRSPDRLDAWRFESLAQAIAMHAFVRPHDVAVATESSSITSEELYAQVVRLLPAIGDLGGPDRRPLAVEMDGSVESVIMAIAVLASSVPLVPVDRHQPDARRTLISELTGATVVDHHSLLAASAPTTTLRTPPGPSPIADPDPDDVAMILMTSGSTGTPKGVLLSHRMCLGKAYDVIGPLVLTPADRLGNVLPLGFGAGMNTLIAGLLAGVPVLNRDPRSTDPAALRHWLRDNGATTLHCSAALGRALTTTGVVATDSIELPGLRVVVYYGEALQGSDLRTMRAGLAPRATVVNWYACTECGVVAFRSFAPDEAVPDGRLAAGRAVRGRRIMIVDDRRRPVEAGEVGEIWIRGGDFAAGYLGGATLPTTRTADGEQWYQTGDRGRVDDDRVVHVVGRVGSSVKIRGYFVEPAEVESALRRVSGVVDAHVAGVEVEGQTELLAHVETDDSENAPAADARSVRALVRRDLPDWMVPRFIEIYDRIPRTDRGKIDRERLRAPGDLVAGSAAALRTSDLTVLGVAEMVRTVMGRDDIGVDDDLIELGADSLALTTILARVTANFHVRVEVARVAADPTIATIAALARVEVAADARTREGLSVLVPLRDGGDRTPLFVVAGAGAPAVSLIPTSRHLAPDRPVFGLQAWGLENRGRPDRSVAAAARRNIAAVVGVAPRGPLLLAGHSMGAHVAWEMAAQLRESGREVAAVILIDPHLTEDMLTDLRGGTAIVGAEVEEATRSELHTGAALDIGLRRLIAVRLKMAVAGLIQFDPLTQWLLFYNLGMATLRKHRPRPLDVPAAVLRTADNLHGQVHWSLMARGPLHIEDVPGGHTDLLREPNVSSVAAAIDTSIRMLDAE
ncbi:AMP-binding protein [Williamsia phyllosphaerae]|uniref:AMP-binding protein n=1 Tax=Williamsia phyllosphaerae TaxID=885042 RepID=UPI0016649209|nr:AMP-binding protein [Williamsia phyllosphaerae]